MNTRTRKKPSDLYLFSRFSTEALKSDNDIFFPIKPTKSLFTSVQMKFLELHLPVFPIKNTTDIIQLILIVPARPRQKNFVLHMKTPTKCQCT